MKKQKKIEKSMEFKKYYLSEFQLHDGEVFITFNIVAIDTSKNEITVAVGDVSNVVFTNGAIARDNGDVYIYYASSDTRLHVATTTIEKLMDYTFNTPSDALRSVDCVKQRYELISKNLEVLEKLNKPELKK